MYIWCVPISYPSDDDDDDDDDDQHPKRSAAEQAARAGGPVLVSFVGTAAGACRGLFWQAIWYNGHSERAARSRPLIQTPSSHTNVLRIYRFYV